MSFVPFSDNMFVDIVARARSEGRAQSAMELLYSDETRDAYTAYCLAQVDTVSVPAHVITEYLVPYMQGKGLAIKYANLGGFHVGVQKDGTLAIVTGVATDFAEPKAGVPDWPRIHDENLFFLNHPDARVGEHKYGYLRLPNGVAPDEVARRFWIFVFYCAFPGIWWH